MVSQKMLKKAISATKILAFHKNTNRHQTELSVTKTITALNSVNIKNQRTRSMSLSYGQIHKNNHECGNATENWTK